MDEAEFIAALRTLPLHSGARNLEDDCAMLEIGRETLVLTHDVMAEGTHFRPDADMADVAWKLVAVNLSDLAAKGADPVGVLLGHNLSVDDSRFLEGLRGALETFDVPLLGGDTVKASGLRQFGLTAIGRATHTPVPSRAGAQVGDGIFVTGPLGRAMLGYEGEAEHLDAFNCPRPLLKEGQALAPHVTAMMDISDGLLLDCWRMASASNATLQLERASIPVADCNRIDECIRWGDDYQLLFTAPPDNLLPVGASRIGTVQASGATMLHLDTDNLSPDDQLGYEHR
ncbi:thiamine-phosphate kinase [Altererythrobacter sp. GH1-8]|uniref:thiamine-phosphate kinase n=1 Tax=Altererythrobacter sp. GH1-8 TaxID=3349333 RepID=UPI00374CCC49